MKRLANYEFEPIKPDAMKVIRRADGVDRRIPLYSRRTQHREYGRTIFKDIVQAATEDLAEDPWSSGKWQDEQ